MEYTKLYYYFQILEVAPDYSKWWLNIPHGLGPKVFFYWLQYYLMLRKPFRLCSTHVSFHWFCISWWSLIFLEQYLHFAKSLSIFSKKSVTKIHGTWLAWFIEKLCQTWFIDKPSPMWIIEKQCKTEEWPKTCVFIVASWQLILIGVSHRIIIVSMTVIMNIMKANTHYIIIIVTRTWL